MPFLDAEVKLLPSSFHVLPSSSRKSIPLGVAAVSLVVFPKCSIPYLKPNAVSVSLPVSPEPSIPVFHVIASSRWTRGLRKIQGTLMWLDTWVGAFGTSLFICASKSHGLVCHGCLARGPCGPFFMSGRVPYPSVRQNAHIPLSLDHDFWIS